MLEAVDQLAQEGERNPELYHLLLGALRALAGPGGPLVVPAFFLKLLTLEGFRPVLDRCASCGADDVDLVAFNDLDGRRAVPVLSAGGRPQRRGSGPHASGVGWSSG